MSTSALEPSAGRNRLRVSIEEKLLWDVADVAGVTGLSTNTINRLRATGEIPAPVDLGIDRVCWRARDIKKWIDERPAAASKRGPVR